MNGCICTNLELVPNDSPQLTLYIGLHLRARSQNGLCGGNGLQAVNLRGFRASVNPRFEAGIPDFIEKFNTF